MLKKIYTDLLAYNYLGFLFHLTVIGVISVATTTLDGTINEPYELPLTFVATVALCALLEAYAKKPAPPAPRCSCSSCGPDQ